MHATRTCKQDIFLRFIFHTMLKEWNALWKFKQTDLAKFYVEINRRSRDRQTDRETDGRTAGLTDGPMDEWTESLTSSVRDRQTLWHSCSFLNAYFKNVILIIIVFKFDWSLSFTRFTKAILSKLENLYRILVLHCLPSLRFHCIS